MGILDEAIREHLQLKRQHGAGESELKQLEDEAFGQSERPGAEGALAEAPTEFMAQPGAGVDQEPVARDEAEPEAVDAQQAKPAGGAPGRREPAAEIASLQEAPEPESEEPADEESPAMEHKAIPEQPPEPEPETGPSTEEREAIADQPTELHDVEGELAGSEPRGPSEEELVEEGIGEPRLAPVDPLSGVEQVDEEEDDFFDQKRLSDELDEALEAPREDEPQDEEPEPASEEPGPEEEAPAADPEEDLLEETPDFLEEAPEDDRLWFEQKPPKDFDFDD